MAIATASYMGVRGSFEGGPCAQNGTGINVDVRNNGLLPVNITRNFRDITDGTSNVFAVGEVRWIRLITNAGGTMVGSNRQFLYGNTTWFGGPDCADNGSTDNGAQLHVRTCHRQLNGQLLATASLHRSFHSEHAGGAHFLMCDGAVKFVSENIDNTATGYVANPSNANGPYGTYQRLAGISDGQVVGDF